MKEKSKKIKICSRGHKYQGNGPCPICWPGGQKKQTAKKNHQKGKRRKA